MKKTFDASARGLTLVEVLVALVLLALAMAMASQAISGWLRASQRQEIGRAHV